MNKSNNPLRLNVGYLYNKPIGTTRETPVDLEVIEIEDLVFRNLSSAVRITRTREGLLLQFEVEAEIKTVCGRCLEEFYLPLHVEFEELYQFPSRYREETDLILPEDGFIDLESLYREYLFLELPIKRLCRPDCKGLCVVCGANLNETTCEHHKKSPSGIIEEEEPV